MDKNLAVSILLKVQNQASGQLRKVSDDLSRVSQQSAHLRQTAAHLAIAGAMMSGAAAALAIPLKISVGAFMDAEAAAAHMSTAMGDGAATQKHIAEAMKVADEIADHHAMTEHAVADAYYIARSNMLNHVQALAAVKTATDLVIGTTKDAADAQAEMEPTTRTLTTLFVNFGDKTKPAVDQIQGFSDMLAKLQTTYAFRDIGEVTYAFEYLMPAAKAAGTSIRDAAAATALLSAAGLHGAEAGTAVQATLSKLSVGGKLMGFAVRNAGGGLDLQKTLMRLNQAFGRLPPLMRDRILASFGFGESDIRGVALLIDKAKDYARVRADLENPRGAAAGARALREAAMDEQMVIAGNRLHAVFREIGTQLAPTVISLIGGFSNLLLRVEEFAQHHTILVKYIALGTALAAVILGVGAALALASAALLGFAAFARIFMIFAGLAGQAAVATKIWTEAQWLLNAALDANPIALAIIGIVALAAAAYEIYKHWAGIKTFFKEWGLTVLSYIEYPFIMLPQKIAEAAKKVKEAAKFLAHGVARFWVGGSPIPEGPLHNLNLGRDIARTLEPNALIAALRRTAAAVAVALPVMVAPVAAAGVRPAMMAPATVARAPFAAPGMTAPGIHLTIHSSPTIVIGGSAASSDTEALVERALAKHRSKLLDEITAEMKRRQRGEY